MEWLDAGYLGLFLATFLAATVLPFSSEAILVGTLLAGLDPLYCLIIASAGNAFGGITSYGLGFLGDWHKLNKWLRVEESRVLRWHETIKKYGSYTAIWCWLPFVGDLIAIALGLFKVRFLPVFFWMTLGKVARYAIIIYFIV